MEIITDIANLTEAKAYEFITEEGTDTAEGAKVIAELKATLADHPELVALAAPQIGKDLRIFCIKFDDVIKSFVNPIIKKKKGQTVFPETCASLPGKEYLIGRPQEITAVYYNDEFKYEDNKFLEQAARIFDQMCQILDGVYPNAFGLESSVEEDGYWSEATEEELREAQEFYLKQYIPRLSEAYKAALNSDEATAKQLKMYQFSEDVINDRTQVIDEEATKAVVAQQRMVNQRNRANRKQDFSSFARKKCKR